MYNMQYFTRFARYECCPHAKRDSTFYYNQDFAERQVSGGEPIPGTNLTTQYIIDVQETVVEGFDFPPLPKLSREQGSELKDVLRGFD